MTQPEDARPSTGPVERLGPLTREQEQIRDECIERAMDEYVRAWFEDHCIWCGGEREKSGRRVPCESCARSFDMEPERSQS